MKLLWARMLLAAALLGACAWATEAAAPPVEEKIILPAAVTKAVPEGVADLRAIQDQVKAVLKKAMPATVAIIIADPGGRGVAAGSGVIISADGYVLTAGHISQTPKQRCTIVLPDGKRIRGETLGWNKVRDAGLVKITEKGKWPHVKMGDSSKLKAGEWCLTVGHPGGYKPGRTPVVRLGRVLSADRGWVQTDTPLVGGDSGGPLFDLAGRVVGIHSWISQRITGNMHVPVNTYKTDWERLVKAEEWGGSRQAYMGVIFDRESDDLKIVEVPEDTPADKAGLKPGDEIAKIDGQKLSKRPELLTYMLKKKPGDEVTVEVLRDGKTVTVKLKLASRPTD